MTKPAALQEEAETLSQLGSPAVTAALGLGQGATIFPCVLFWEQLGTLIQPRELMEASSQAFEQLT